MLAREGLRRPASGYIRLCQVPGTAVYAVAFVLARGPLNACTRASTTACLAIVGHSDNGYTNPYRAVNKPTCHAAVSLFHRFDRRSGAS